MPRARQKYVLIKRTHKSGSRVYYVRFAGEKNAHSTGCTNKEDAHDYARAHLEGRPAPSAGGNATLGELLEPAYDWDRCPHVKRLRAEGKIIGRQHCENQRRLVVKHVLPDKLCRKAASRVSRGDILELRDRLADRSTPGQANKALSAIRAVLREYVYREELGRNPCDGVGKLAEHSEERGVLNGEELKALFGKRPGPWGNLQAYACFLLAATTGMRRSELLALTWDQVDFDALVIHVRKAFKGTGEVGRPKWEKIRSTFLPDRASQVLLELRAKSIHVLPNSLVFCDGNGKRRGGTWWEKRFRSAMVEAGFMGEVKDGEGKVTGIRNPRNLVPHSLRHSVATHLRAGGIDAAAIRASMGWSSEQVQEGYTHWGPEHFGDQKRAVDELFG